jgi:hypothetical protein
MNFKPRYNNLDIDILKYHRYITGIGPIRSNEINSECKLKLGIDALSVFSPLAFSPDWKIIPNPLSWYTSNCGQIFYNDPVSVDVDFTNH